MWNPAASAPLPPGETMLRQNWVTACVAASWRVGAYDSSPGSWILSQQTPTPPLLAGIHHIRSPGLFIELRERHVSVACCLCRDPVLQGLHRVWCRERAEPQISLLPERHRFHLTDPPGEEESCVYCPSSVIAQIKTFRGEGSEPAFARRFPEENTWLHDI